MHQIPEKNGESFVARRGCVSMWFVWKIEKRRAIRSNRVCATLSERSIDSVENEIRCIRTRDFGGRSKREASRHGPRSLANHPGYSRDNNGHKK